MTAASEIAPGTEKSRPPCWITSVCPIEAMIRNAANGSMESSADSPRLPEAMSGLTQKSTASATQMASEPRRARRAPERRANVAMGRGTHGRICDPRRASATTAGEPHPNGRTRTPPIHPSVGYVGRAQLGGAPHRLHHLRVARATAEVAGEGLADLVLGRVWHASEQVARREELAGQAEAALESVLVPERLLDRVQLLAGGEALDRRDLCAVGAGGEDQARLHDAAVARDGAGAAVAVLAADMG